MIAAVFAIQQIPSSFGHRAMVAFSRVHWAAQGVALGVFLMVAGALSPAGVAPFIYFQF